MKQSSSMITGSACSGSSTPPMPAPPEMCTFLPIWAQLPTVAQVSTMVPLLDIGAEIDEAGHQHDVRRDVGGVPHDAARHRAKARARELVGAPAGELGGHLVPPAGAARPALDRAPAGRRRNDSSTAFFSHWWTCQRAVDLLGDAQAAGIEPVERGLDRRAHRARR